jgi:hypothetical protein
MLFFSVSLVKSVKLWLKTKSKSELTYGRREYNVNKITMHDVGRAIMCVITHSEKNTLKFRSNFKKWTVFGNKQENMISVEKFVQIRIYPRHYTSKRCKSSFCNEFGCRTVVEGLSTCLLGPVFVSHRSCFIFRKLFKNNFKFDKNWNIFYDISHISLNSWISMKCEI